MKKRYVWLLLISLALCSGTLLLNRFVVAIPSWLAITNIAVAIVCMILYLILFSKANKQ